MSIFSSKRFLSWSEAAVSLIPGSGILILISITDQTLFGDPQGLLSLLQAPLAIAFGAVFFAPAWRRIPIQIEGMLIEWRYEGRGARVLSVFRNGMLTFVVAPLLMALILVSVVDWPTLKIQDRQQFFIAVSILLIVFSFLNSIRQRLKMDIVIGALTLLITGIYAITAISGATALSNTWEEKIQPVLQNINGIDLTLSSCIVWWFSGIVDMPDMRAQKLLATKQNWRFWNPVAISALLILLVQGIFLAYPPSTSGNNWLQLAIIALLILNGLTAMLDLQHWAGGAFIEGAIHLSESVKSNKKISGVLVMMTSTLIAFGIASCYQNASTILMQILSFSAGVGPVYILRWTWHRINAWTQFSAMLGAMIIGLFWPFVSETFSLEARFNSYFLANHILPGILNCCIWIVVILMTKNSHSSFSSKRKIAIAGVLYDLKKWKSWAAFIALAIVLFLAMYWPVMHNLSSF